MFCTRLGWAAVCCQWLNCSLICEGLTLGEASSAALVSRQTEAISRVTSCRNSIREFSRLDWIRVLVAVLTSPLHLYCKTASNASTAASAGTAAHRKRRSLNSAFVIKTQARDLCRNNRGGKYHELNYSAH